MMSSSEKRWLMKPPTSSFPCASSLMSMREVSVLTSPVVIVRFWIHAVSSGKFDGLAVHADVGDVAARPHDGQRHVPGRRHADSLDGDIHAETVCEGDHLLLPVRVRRDDAVACAEALRLLDPVGVYVDRDDAARPVEGGCRHRGEANRTGADDRDDIARLDRAVSDADLDAPWAGCR